MIVVEPFDRTQFLSSARLFSTRYDDISRYAYHGTSTAYAAEIESQGLSPTYQPIDTRELQKLADSLPQVSADLAGSIRSHAASPTRLGFSPYPHAAVEYSLNGGGQIVSLCRDAIGAGAQPSESLRAFLKRFDANGGTVYAVDLSDFNLDALTFEGIFFQCRASVPASRICAKVEIPSSFSRAELKGLNAPELYRARLQIGSLAYRAYNNGRTPS